MIPHAQRRRERAIPSVRHAVRLHIDQLLLRGFLPAEARRLSRALEAELASLAAEPRARFVPIVADEVPAMRIVAGRIPEQTGRLVASALWSGITGTEQGHAGQGGPES